MTTYTASLAALTTPQTPPFPAAVRLADVLHVIDSRLAYLQACDGSYKYEHDLLTIRREIVDMARQAVTA